MNYLQHRLTVETDDFFRLAGERNDNPAKILGAVMLTLIPLFIVIGLFLGTLVVVGQFSKEGPMEKLTAVMLVVDVLLKVGVTVVTETADYMLHLRVRPSAFSVQSNPACPAYFRETLAGARERGPRTHGNWTLQCFLKSQWTLQCSLTAQ